MRSLRLLFCLLLVLGVFCCPALAAESEPSPEGLLDDLWEALPDAAKDALPTEPESEAVKEQVGFTHLVSSVIAAFTDTGKQQSSVFLRLLGLSLLFSAVAAYGGHGSLTETAMSLVLGVALYGTLSDTLGRVTLFFHDLSEVSLAFAPVMAGVFAMGGGTATAAAAGSGFAAFLGILQTLCLGVLQPLLRILFAMSLIGCIGTVPALGETERTVKGLYLFLLGLVCTLLGASLSFQTSLASGSDSVALRTVKFAIGNAVPVVGGTVSSALGALTASLQLVKSTAGAAALVVLAGLLLPLLAELFWRRLALSLAASVGAMVGASGVVTVFSRFRALYDLMLATVCMVSLLFLLLVGILARCALPLAA